MKKDGRRMKRERERERKRKEGERREKKSIRGLYLEPVGGQSGTISAAHETVEV